MSYGFYLGVVLNEKIMWGKFGVKMLKFIVESDVMIVVLLIFSWILGC